MDLLSGLVTANAPISQQNGVGSYIEGNTAGQAATKARIENENAKFQQDLTTRMQKAISNSVNPDGSINFKLLAKNGAAEGIAPQMQKQMADILTQQWDSIAKTAQSKMQLRQQAPQGYQQLQTEVNQDNQTGELPWSQRPASAGGQGATQSSSRAVAVPSEPVASPSPSEDNSGETAENYAYLTPDEKYTSSRPIKNVNGQIVNDGSQADLAAQYAENPNGLVTPDMLQANQTTTGGSGVSEGAGQVNVTGSQLNPNAIISDELYPDTSTETAPDIGANYGQAPQGQPAQQNAPVAQAQQTGTESSNPYDIANKMDVMSPSQMLGGQGVGGGNGGYFQVTNDTSDEALNTIRTNLERNANLPKGASRDVINQYLKAQQDKDYAAVGPAPVLLPNAEGKYDYNDYGKRMQEWNKNFAKVSADWAEKYGKEYADQLSQQISKDTNNRAELQLQNDATKYNNDVNGRNQYAKQISSVLGLGGTLNAATFGSIKEMQDFAERASAYKKLLGPAPTDALGQLGWAKNFIQAEGLGEAEGTMKLVQLLAAKNPLIRSEIELTYGGNIASVGLQGLGQMLGKLNGEDLSNLTKEMKFGLDWKSHTGGVGLKPIGSEAPNTTEAEMDNTKPGDETKTSTSSDNIVKTGWYNSPAKATGDTFQTDNGSVYKVASRGPVSGLPKTVIDDNGSVYSVSDRNPADPNSKVDLIPQTPSVDKTPWSQRPAKPRSNPPAPIKTKAGPKVGDKNSKGQIWSGKRWLP